MADPAWRAYYTDNRRYASTDTAWTALPDTGVLGVVVFFEQPYRVILDGGDWYWLDDSGVPTLKEAHEEWGRYVDKPADVPDDELKQGEAVTDSAFAEVKQSMLEDRTWP